MAIKNHTGRVLRFVDDTDQVVATLQPESVTVNLEETETITRVNGVRVRTLKNAAFVGLPAAVGGTQLICNERISLALWERVKGRTDVYEPEEPILVNGDICYRGARRYID